MWPTLVYLAVTIVGGVSFAWLIHDWLPFTYERILSRSVLLFAAVGLIPLWRKLSLNAAEIGLAPINRQIVIPGYLLGLLLLGPLILFFTVTGFRVSNTAIDFAAWDWWRFLIIAFVSAWLVGVFEETLFRGVFFGRLRQSRSFGVAAVVSSLVYASVHFVRAPDDVVHESINFVTGFVMVSQAFSGLTVLSDIWDSFLALFLLGILFCVIRQRFGLWACIALHSAWVFGIRTFKELTVRDVVNPFAGWVGSYDHFVGNLVTAWLLFIFVVLALRQQYQTQLR